jgi:hypothetical protein
MKSHRPGGGYGFGVRLFSPDFTASIPGNAVAVKGMVTGSSLCLPLHPHALKGRRLYGLFCNDAAIDIRTGNILKGALPKSALNLVKQWATLHQQELLDDWELARNRKPLNKIAPLP